MPPCFHSFKVDQRTCQCCSFCSSLLCFSAGTWSAAGTTNSRLLCRIVDHSKTIGQKGRGVGGGGVGGERVFLRQLDLFLFSVPHHMPIQGASGCWEAGESHPPTQSRGLCCAAHRERVEGWREAERCEKRCEERNYEFSAWKVQVLLKVMSL